MNYMPDGKLDLLRDREKLRDTVKDFLDELRAATETLKVYVERVPKLALPEKPVLFPYFTYPSNGTKATIPKGINAFDFWDGTVFLADGTEDFISDKLQAYPLQDYIRSFQIDVNKAVVIWLDEFGKKPVDSDDIHLENFQNFKRLYVETTEATQIAVWASTNPQAYVRTLKPAIFRGVTNEFYEVVNPVSEYGNPIAELGRYSGTSTSYQTLASWTVTTGYYGDLREISFTSNANALFQLTIGGVVQFTDLKVVAPPSFPFPSNKMAAASVVLLEVKSTGAAIEVNGSIAGKEVPET